MQTIFTWQNMLRAGLVTGGPLVVKNRLELTERRDSPDHLQLRDARAAWVDALPTSLDSLYVHLYSKTALSYSSACAW